MKLGEMLIQLGQISAEQLEAARRAQSASGGRLGTHLVEMGFLGTDQLSSALGRVLGVPSALEHHFAQADPLVVARLKPGLAARFQAVPLGLSRKESKRVVVAMADPLDLNALDDLTFALSAPVEPMVAPEQVIAWNIKRLYGVDMDVKARPPAAPDAVTRGPHRNPRPLSPDATLAPARPTAVRPEGASAPAPVRMRPLPPVPPAPAPKEKTRLASPLAFDEALRRITMAQDREALVDILRDFMAGYFGCGMVFGIRDGQAKVARGFAQGLQSAAVETIAFPVSMPSCFRAAHDSRTTFRGPPPAEGQRLHLQIWKYLRCSEPLEVLVAPILVKNRVLNLVYAHADEQGPLPDGPVTDVLALCAASSSVYVRMIQRLKEGEPSALAR